MHYFIETILMKKTKAWILSYLQQYKRIYKINLTERSGHNIWKYEKIYHKNPSEDKHFNSPKKMSPYEIHCIIFSKGLFAKGKYNESTTGKQCCNGINFISDFIIEEKL